MSALPGQNAFVSAVKGIAQMTGGNLNGGACMLDNYTLPQDVYGAALAGPNWNAASMCGGCITVQGPKGSVLVMVSCSSYVPAGLLSISNLISSTDSR